MNLEDLQEFIKDEKNAGAFKDIVKALGYETPDDISGLKSNRDEFRRKYEKIRTDYEEMQKKLADIDIDEYHTLKESKGKKPDDDYTKLQREHKRLQDQLKFDQEEKTKLQTAYHNTLRESALSKALEANKFTQHNKLLTDAFLGKTTIEIIDGRPIVSVISDDMQIEISDYFKKFANTEIGKMYVDKPVNSGAGSQNISGSGNAKTMPRTEYDKMSSSERMEYTRQGGTIQ